MAAPWATAAGSTITVGQVTGAGISVTSGGSPDASWYCQFKGANGRFVRGGFGLAGSGSDLLWSLSSFPANSKGTLASVILTAAGTAGLNHLTYLGSPVVTVWERTGNPNPTSAVPSQIGQIAQAYPAARDRSYLNSTATEDLYKTVLRQFWERRDSELSPAVSILDPIGNLYQGGVYTLQPSDLGKQIRVRETTSDKDGTSTVYGPWISVSGGTLAADRVYQKDLTYLGAFRGPGTNDFEFTKYGGWAMSFDSAGNGGYGSLFMAEFYNNHRFGEITIPALVNSSSISALNIASFTARNPGPVEASEGQLNDSGIPSNLWRRFLGSIVYNNKLIMSANVGYANRTPVTHWRRPLTLATTGQLEGPVELYNATYTGPREKGGRMCHVPDSWQIALGGPVLVGAVNYSLNQNMSHGPSAFAFNPDDIASKTFVSGTCQSQAGMAANQIKLAGGANGSFIGRMLAITGGAGFQSTEPSGVFRITAWDNTAKIATLDVNRSTSYDSTTTYKIFDQIQATVNAFYPAGSSTALEDSSLLGTIFQFSPAVWVDAISLCGMAIPFGTRTLLFAALCGNGFARYNNVQSQYDPQYPVTGPRAFPYFLRFYAYDLNDLAAVKVGSQSPWSIRPYAVWNSDLKIAPTGADMPSMCYDTSNRRLYIAQHSAGYFGEAVIHAFRIENAAVA